VETWDGDAYQRRVEQLAAEGGDPHGEADLVGRYRPTSVLDAGCGTGRVAIELASRGIEVVGVDIDLSMLTTARRMAPDLEFVEHDLVDLELNRRFDVVLMAGNVPLFTRSGTTGALLATCARHVAPNGVVIAGFSLDRGYDAATYDAEAAAAGLQLRDRWATWERDAWTPDATYAVSVHTLAGAPVTPSG
jgi:2-polyprenyl-3-methyl-5-hydroxy-6-metoxy-1,4-benzoquinol methylase